MDPIKVYIGTERAQRLPTMVLKHSILSRTQHPVDFFHLDNIDTPIQNMFRTGFSFFRWAIPMLANHQGRAIYLDADIICYCDIAELWNYEMGDHTHMARYRGDGNSYTSVMLIDCEKCHWPFEDWCNQAKSSKTLYKRFMDAHPDAPSNKVIGAIPDEFNVMVERGDVYDKKTAKMVHFTGLDKQPWRFPRKHPLERLFHQELNDAIKAGFMERKTVEREVKKGYCNKDLLRHV